MSDKLLLTSEFRPGLDGKKILVTLRAETPEGPLNLSAWGEDLSSAVKNVMARVEQIASHRKRGRKPKDYHACRYVRWAFFTPTRISSLNSWGGKTAEQLLGESTGAASQTRVAPPAAPTVQATPQPTGRVIASAVSNLLH
jgi:hypothetical protein